MLGCLNGISSHNLLKNGLNSGGPKIRVPIIRGPKFHRAYHQGAKLPQGRPSGGQNSSGPRILVPNTGRVPRSKSRQDDCNTGLHCHVTWNKDQLGKVPFYPLQPPLSECDKQ